MAVTPEGGDKQELFDLVKTTQHPEETCPDGFTHMQPMKFYTSDDLVEYMKGGGKNLKIWWVDFVLYKNKEL